MSNGLGSGRGWGKICRAVGVGVGSGRVKILAADQVGVGSGSGYDELPPAPPPAVYTY